VRDAAQQPVAGDSPLRGPRLSSVVDQPERLGDMEVVDAVVAAQSDLLHYVNRKGTDFSGGEWTRAGTSLFLMQRDDGKGFTIKADGE
jgi:hypothetical protein